MFNTLEKEETPHKTGKRTVFIVSDATAITAETLAHSVLTQFTDLEYDQIRIPFIDTPEVAEITKYIARQQSYPTAYYLPEYVDEEDVRNLYAI